MFKIYVPSCSLFLQLCFFFSLQPYADIIHASPEITFFYSIHLNFFVFSNPPYSSFSSSCFYFRPYLFSPIRFATFFSFLLLPLHFSLFFSLFFFLYSLCLIHHPFQFSLPFLPTHISFLCQLHLLLLLQSFIFISINLYLLLPLFSSFSLPPLPFSPSLSCFLSLIHVLLFSVPSTPIFSLIPVCLLQVFLLVLIGWSYL